MFTYSISSKEWKAEPTLFKFDLLMQEVEGFGAFQSIEDPF